MERQDRIYLNGLRDDLCARWGFTWQDVVMAENRKRVQTNLDSVRLAMVKATESMQKTVWAFKEMFEVNS